jgi:pimeloyl-ACP methyl ester carboxylesterase
MRNRRLLPMYSRADNSKNRGTSMRKILGACLAGCLWLHAGAALAQDVWDQVEHHYADSNGVKIHYATLGEGPLVVMIHGFPDFWYTWRHQMRALADQKYRVAAVDLRGYDLSDKPKGVENYAIPLLVEDIAAVIRAEKVPDAIVVGHDWGGAVAWNVAMQKPELTRLLVICNLPHPAGIAREIITNPQQKKNSEYAFNFQKPDAHKTLCGRGTSRRSRSPISKACSTTTRRTIRSRMHRLPRNRPLSRR